MKKPLKIALYALLALVLIVLAYVIYVFAAYYRVEDYQSLDVVRTTCESPVPMEDAAEADMIFSLLMGEKVEPRREFIERNAKYVVNLDI